VDLDCVGDPGAWLDIELSSVEEVLLGDPQDDELHAEPLADAYIRAGLDLPFPLPTEFGESPEKMRKNAIAEFVGFIREWRRRAEAAGCIKRENSGHKGPISTWGLLPSLGFVPDPDVWSDVMPGLCCNFGNVKVYASCVLSLRCKEVVLFTGVLTTEHTISEICFEMLRHVESREQCVAWLAWGLDKAADVTFKPRIPVPWLEEGRRHRDTLPWERQRAAYAARPHCSVSREWARIAVKTLAEYLAQVEGDAPVTFRFDGEVLTIRCADKVVALPAKGRAWSHVYSISAGSFWELPKRLMRPEIGVSIWDSALTIGNRCFSGVAEVSSEKTL
jgi:hypothetical protein